VKSIAPYLCDGKGPIAILASATTFTPGAGRRWRYLPFMNYSMLGKPKQYYSAEEMALDIEKGSFSDQLEIPAGSVMMALSRRIYADHLRWMYKP
jgi:hypothetical protein